MTVEKWTKADIIDAAYVRTGLNKAYIREIYECIFTEIKTALVAGKTVELRGIGTFKTALRSGRATARNPRTGEAISIEPRRAVSFRPGQELRAAVRPLVEPRTDDAPPPAAPPYEAKSG
jgi:integration host factor subunit beta